VTSKTYNKGLTIRVDHDDVAGDDWRERYVQLLLQRLYRNELRRAVSALSGSAVSQGYTWDASAGTANPDSEIRTELEAASSATGVRPNRVIFGEGAWDARSDVYDAQNNAGANRAAGLSLDELARKLFVDEVRVMGARYQDVSSKTAILGNEIYAFFTKK